MRIDRLEIENFNKFARQTYFALLMIFVVCFVARISFCGPPGFPQDLRSPRPEDRSAGESSPVAYRHFRRITPNLSIYWIKLNLDDSNICVHVSKGGNGPDGNGPWVTTLLPTSEIAEREHYDIAVNGDFFDAQNTVDVEGKKTGYIRGKLAAPVGPAMTDGQLWHRATNSRPCLEITASNTAKILVLGPSDAVDPAARQLISGGQVIVRNGQPVIYTNSFSSKRNPRTAVGIDRTGRRMMLLVVDGRQPDLSVGMTLSELSDEMIAIGSDCAINLDGGGSSTMVYRDPLTKRLKVINSPSDTRERSVADVLGVTVKAPLPPLN